MKPAAWRLPAIRAAVPRVGVCVRLLLAMTVILAVQDRIWGQGVAIDVRVVSVSGLVLLSRSNNPAVAITRDTVLFPGDEIQTGSGGSLTIELSDGSVIIVKPGSRVVLKDYRSASSLRELLEITRGYVYLKINHLGGRPNPYRVNSPTASIAVRGTKFSVEVNSLGDTRVAVYDGLVEVVSLSNPRRRVLVEPGRGVIVRANRGIQFFVPAQTREMGEGNEGRDSPDRTQEVSPNSNTFSDAGGEEESPREIASTYQRYVASLSEIAQMPFLMRFVAFSDPHLDSLENPAYATGFTNADGRVFLLPSFSGAGGVEESQAAFGGGSPRPIDFAVSPQGSFFAPVGRAHATVVGGGIAASHNGVHSFSSNAGITLMSPLFPYSSKGTRYSADFTTSTFVIGSLISARRFGSTGRTTVGVGLDLINGQGSLLSLITQSDSTGLTSNERIKSVSNIRQMLFKLGLTRDLAGGHKLGVLYRYGVVSANDSEQVHTFNATPLPLDSTLSSGHSSEIGLRLRGPLTDRLFYGVDGTWLSIKLDDRLKRATSVDAHQGESISREAFGAGLGFMVSPRLIFSFDAAGGFSHANNLRREDATGNLLETRSDQNRFFSLHAALQANLWRQLFVNSSFLAVMESHHSHCALYPDRLGRLLSSDCASASVTSTSGRSIIYFSDFGVGWRFSRNFLAQYVLSTDYGFTSPRHTLLLRYTFSFPHR